MKSIVITANQPRHLAFVKMIQRNTDLLGVVIEEKPVSTKTEKQEEFFSHFAKIESKYFPKTVDIDDLSVLKCCKGQVNQRLVKEWIEEKQVDNLFVFGSSLLKPEIFTLPRNGTVNIHTGLVQMFRGVDSSFWAISEEKPQGIGATVHFIDRSIDAGGVIGQERPRLNIQDTLHDIFCKTVLCGFGVLEEILSSSYSLTDTGQKLNSWGTLYQTKDFNDEKIFEAEKKLQAVLSSYLNQKEKMDATMSLITG
jgi:methionyl-tRNA formyltransferase